MKMLAAKIFVAAVVVAPMSPPTVAAAAPRARSSSAPAQIVLGELLVTFKDGVSASDVAAFARAHHVHGTYLSTVNVYVVHVPEVQASAAMARMKRDFRVFAVERSYVMEASDRNA